MNRYVLFFLMFTFHVVSGQKGKVMLSDSIHSDILGRYVKYSVYLPPAYGVEGQTFPVTYLLHGLGGNERDYLEGFHLGVRLDSCIQAGGLPSMIIICPDGYQTFYTNDYKGDFRWEDFFMREFIPAMEKTYTIDTSREKRSLAGISRGGYGAVKLAMKYPDRFSGASGMSAAIRNDEDMTGLTEAGWKERNFDKLFGEGVGRDRLTGNWYDNSVLRLAETKDTGALKKVRYWLDCGDDDYLDNGNYELHRILKKRGVYHEYRVRDGGHEFNYWVTGILPALQFIYRNSGR